MTGRVKHKSRGADRSSDRPKKKKSRKRSASSSGDCVIVTSDKNSTGRGKKLKSQKRKRRRSTSSSSNYGDSCIGRIKISSQPRQLLGERPEFCRNGASFRANNGELSKRSRHRSNTQENRKRRKEGPDRIAPREEFPSIQRRVQCVPMNDKERGRQRGIKEHPDNRPTVKKSKKSRKRRRSSSRSSHSSSSSSSSSSGRRSSSSSSSSSGSSSCSSGSSYERRKRRRKKKKLAKKMKRAEKKRREEKRKLKKIKERSREPVREIKRSIAKEAQDRLLKDINVELADRARAMAPMTREEWEKKQSVIRRVYDEETGRHRLIKGDGEILEEIVSRDRHMEINRQATKGDGEFFQSRLRINK